MSNDRAQAFADALQQLESGGDVDAFVGVFTDDVTLVRPEVDQQVEGTDGAQQYWRQYLAQFDEVHSTFSRVVDSGELGILEWTSEGALAGGAPITYRGVSLLDFDDDGRITRFSTYFDTAQFVSKAL